MILMLLIMALPLVGLALFFVLPLRHALPAYVAAVALSLFYHRLMRRSTSQPVATGRPGMIGLTAVVRTWNKKTGTVRCRGETWNARVEGEETPTVGATVKVVDVDGMTLVVAPLRPAEAPPDSR